MHLQVKAKKETKLLTHIGLPKLLISKSSETAAAQTVAECLKSNVWIRKYTKTRDLHAPCHDVRL